MEKANLPKCIINWYKLVLENRKVLAQVQGQKYVAYPTKGTPQGEILSPLIWILFMNSILTKFTTGAVRAIGYADDIVLYITGFDPFTMAGIMTQSLHTVWQWGEKHGLVFNPSKTVVCMYETDRKYKHEPPVYMGGKQLLYPNKLKYLGITIDKCLIWSKHVDDRINKCSFLLNKMNSVIGREWGLTPARAKCVYSAIIKPKLTYGCVVWAHAVTKSSEKTPDRL